MADNTTTIDIKVEATKATNSLKQLRDELKKAKSDALNGDGAAAKRVAELTDKMDDLKDSVQTLKGSGIEQSKNSFALLVDSVKNLDFDKFKIGLAGLKTALASTGILLLVQGVTYLIENFDELSQGSGLLAKSLRFVGDVIATIKDAVFALTDALGLTNSELDKQGEAIKTNADKATEALARQTAEYDRQIAIAKASGKSAVDLEIAKQKAIIETNKALVQQTIAYVRSGGILDEEQNKLLTGQLEAIKSATAQIDVIKLQEVEKEKEKNKKSNEDYKNKLAKDEAELNRHLKETTDAYLKRQAEQEAADKLAADNELKDAETREQAKLDLVTRAEIAKLDAKKKAFAEEEKRQKAMQQLEAESLQITQQGLMASQQLAEAFFMFRLNSVRKGSAEEERIARKAFQVNKALQLATATVQGFQAVQGAFTTAAASPITTVFPAYPFIQAGIAGAFSAASIAKIAASQFQGGGGGSLNAPNVSVPNAPVISTPQNNVSGTQFDNNGNVINQQQNQQQNIMVKAVVVESEMTESQNIITKYKKQSTF